MGELQATIELAIHLHKFYNVDLFQRGYYQLRVFLRSTPKLPTKVELSLPRSATEWKGGSGLVFPACVVNGAAVSKTFQILYRNEEVHLDDHAHFKLHLIVDSNKIADSLDRSDLQLIVELWFTESSFGPNHHNAIQCVSARTLNLHFSPTRGLHYHLPILFDYFHLSAVTMTIHAGLVSLHQPYIKKTILNLVDDCGGKSAKSWSSPKTGGRAQQSNMENVFFGNINSTVKCSGGGSGITSWRLAQARGMHRTICTLLLAANTALTAQLETLLAIIPPWAVVAAPNSSNSSGTQQPQNASSSNAPNSAPSTPQPTRIKIDNLSEVAKECYYSVIGSQNSTPTEKKKDNLKQSLRIQSLECEEDFLATANSDIAHLCAENILLWKHFISVVSGSESVRQHLARNHHIQRARRFAEAFFVIDNPRPSATGCYDSNYQNYAIISDAARRSKYFALLPSLPVECVEMDGDLSTLPIVFEDQYQHVAEFARRRSIVKNKSEKYLSANDIQIAVDQIDSPEAKREVLNPPDVTKGEPSFNGTSKPKPENATVFHVDSKTLNRNLKIASSGLDTKSLSNAVTVNVSPEVLFQNKTVNKYGTHPLKSSTQSKHAFTMVTSKRDLKKRYSDFKISENKHKSAETRSKSNDSRASTWLIEETLVGATGSDLDEKNLTFRDRFNEEDKPPVPPRTDKMPKDFKPPIPPKLHKLPIARSSLKEKLKNNLRLELKVPPTQGVNYKKAKFKVKLMQRAQQLRGTSKTKKAKANANSDVVLLKYRRLEPSLSMPYDLGANTPGATSACSTDQPMRHSQSTLSMPSFLWDVACTSSPGVAESLPDLLATDSETSSESHMTHTHPPKRNPPILSNVEVGLVSATDHALLHVNKGKLKAALGLATAKSKEILKSTIGKLDSSSNSDITSEQSGWVSNSSRQSSGSSSGQVSPELDMKKYPLSDGLSTTPYKVNGKMPIINPPCLPSNPKQKSLMAKSSPPVISKSSQKESKSVKENSLRSISNEQIKAGRKKSPNRKEVKKSHSLQKVNNSPKTVYDQAHLPPPPKEFQDPTPGAKRLIGGGFSTTGKIPREERITRLTAQSAKNRPRSESPRTENVRNGIEELKPSEKSRVYWTTNSRLSADFDLEDIASVEESLSEVLNEVKKSLNKKSTGKDKFNSLPSMRKRHQSAGAASKKTVKKKPATPDHLSEPSVLNIGLSATLDRVRTHSAPTANDYKNDGTKFLRRSEPITNKSTDPLSNLPENKVSLLELFLEQQGASVWAQRDSQRNILKEDQRVPKMSVKKKENKPSREKSKSQPDLNDGFIDIPPPPKPPSPCRTEPKCTCPSDVRKERIRTEEPQPDLLPQKFSPPVPNTVAFIKAREDFRQQINFQGLFYSDFSSLASSVPYFHVSDDCRVLSPDGLHLIVCVHGLDGNSADLRLIKTYLEIGLPGSNLDFLMSERNQGDTFSNFETLTDRLVSEILYHMEFYNLNPKKISFVGHSLGNIIIRGVVSHPQMKPYLPKLHTFLSLSGPHLGTLYNNSGLVNMGMWFMQKWKKSGSLLQLALKDRVDIRQTFLYKLSQRSQLHNFKNVLLCGSSQDRYVPLHSARVELCRQAVRDNSVIGAAYREMVSNLLQPIICSPSVTLVRFDIHHALPSTANSLIGRAAHIAVLDSELFIEKFLLVTGLKYFK